MFFIAISIVRLLVLVFFFQITRAQTKLSLGNRVELCVVLLLINTKQINFRRNSKKNSIQNEYRICRKEKMALYYSKLA